MLWGAHWWDALTALGTVSAVAVSVAVGLVSLFRALRAESALAAERRQRVDDQRRATAGLVAAWAESTYEPSSDGTHYLRRVTAHLANESSEPVFHVNVVIGYGTPVVQLGPLSIPAEIPVLPARQTRSWDVTAGFLAHSTGNGQIPSDPVVSASFEDSRGVSWIRQYDGTLAMEPVQQTSPIDEATGLAQMGPFEGGFNPHTVATAFLASLSTAKSVDELKPLLSPTATGWKDITPAGIDELRAELEPFGLAAHVYYPTPRIAYVRLIHDDDIEKLRRGEPGRASVITLVFLVGVGWRVFSAGGAVTEPDWIKFPRRDLLRDVRG